MLAFLAPAVCSGLGAWQGVMHLGNELTGAAERLVSGKEGKGTNGLNNFNINNLEGALLQC